jgi:hypothetical protein
MTNNTGFLDIAVLSVCKNFIDSYGMICVGCNCCGRLNPKTKYASRLKVAKRHLKEEQEDLTKSEFQTELQQKNIRSNIRSFKRQIIYNEQKRKAIKVIK